jgi:hypothetical protein
VASLRDDMQVLTGTVHRLDNSHTRLLHRNPGDTLVSQPISGARPAARGGGGRGEMNQGVTGTRRVP